MWPGSKIKVKAAKPDKKLISLSMVVESVTHGQFDARPMVTSLAAERHRPLAGNKLAR